VANERSSTDDIQTQTMEVHQSFESTATATTTTRRRKKIDDGVSVLWVRRQHETLFETQEERWTVSIRVGELSDC